MSSTKGVVGGQAREGTRVVLREITAMLHNSPPSQTSPRRKSGNDNGNSTFSKAAAASEHEVKVRFAREFADADLVTYSIPESFSSESSYYSISSTQSTKSKNGIGTDTDEPNSPQIFKVVDTSYVDTDIPGVNDLIRAYADIRINGTVEEVVSPNSIYESPDNTLTQTFTSATDERTDNDILENSPVKCNLNETNVIENDLVSLDTTRLIPNCAQDSGEEPHEPICVDLTLEPSQLEVYLSTEESVTRDEHSPQESEPNSSASEVESVELILETSTPKSASPVECDKAEDDRVEDICGDTNETKTDACNIEENKPAVDNINESKTDTSNICTNEVATDIVNESKDNSDTVECKADASTVDENKENANNVDGNKANANDTDENKPDTIIIDENIINANDINEDKLDTDNLTEDNVNAGDIVEEVIVENNLVDKKESSTESVGTDGILDDTLSIPNDICITLDALNEVEQYEEFKPQRQSTSLSNVDAICALQDLELAAGEIANDILKSSLEFEDEVFANPGLEVFQDPTTFDFLSARGNSEITTRFRNESLYIKFDPLLANTSMLPQGNSQVFSTPPSGTIHKLEEIQEKNDEPIQVNKSDTKDVEDADATEKLELVRATVSQLEKELEKQKKEYEAKLDKQKVAYQDKITKLQAQINQEIENKNQLTVVVDEYEKSISRLLTEKERDRTNFEQEKTKIQEELQATNLHLSNTEAAFNDVHLKYERLKGVVSAYKNNEGVLKESIQENLETIKSLENRYDQLKTHAMSQLRKANLELVDIRKQHEAETVKLHAMVRKAELKSNSLAEIVEQKTKENKELTQILDELIARVGRQNPE